MLLWTNFLSRGKTFYFFEFCISVIAASGPLIFKLPAISEIILLKGFAFL